MKLKLTFILLCGVAIATVLAAIAIRQSQNNSRPAVALSDEQTFEVKGQIRSVEADESAVHISHEEIPGFMPAMTMPFTVRDAALLRGLAAGDAVKFQLAVTKDDSWITRIEKLDSHPATTIQAQSSVGSKETRRIEIGELVPDFTLTNQLGHAFRLADFRGKAVVLTFIYTRCPLPNYCPLMSKNFAMLQERFQKEFPGRVELLSVSFDPQFDTPAVLRDYAARYGADEKNWSVATGSTEQINLITGQFGLIREPTNGLINHDLRTALIGPDGKLVHIWRSNVWTPYEVQRMVRETFDGNKVVAVMPGHGTH